MEKNEMEEHFIVLFPAKENATKTLAIFVI
jgi:hypothetical protein